MTISFVSGYGQFHTARLDAKKPRPYEGITSSEILTLIAQPQNVPKGRARWVIPHNHTGEHGRAVEFLRDAQNGVQWWFLWADIDDNNPTLDTVVKATQNALSGRYFAVYSSKSATPTQQKWRVIVPLGVHVNAQTFEHLQTVLNNLLEQNSLAVDRASECCNQLCYLPNQGEVYEHHIHEGELLKPIDWQPYLDLIQPQTTQHQTAEGLPQTPNQSGDAAYLRAAVMGKFEDAVGRMGRAPDGTKHTTLLREASLLGGLLHFGFFNQQQAVDALVNSIAARCEAVAQARKTAEQALESGQNTPITVDELLAQRKPTQQPVEIIRDTQLGEWGELDDIAPELPPVAPLGADMLPAPFQVWLSDISERMQCPLDYVAVGGVVSAAAVIGTGCGIKPKRLDDWQITPNLWGGVVGNPSMLKTPALAEAMLPLSKLEAEAMEEFEGNKKTFEVDNAFYEARREALNKQIKTALKGGDEAKLDALRDEMLHLETPAIKPARRFKTNNATVEKLGEVLRENRRGVLLFRDELAGWLNGLERDDRTEDRAFYLETFNGTGAFTFDRIGRGTVHIGNLCVSLLGGIQPDKLAQYLKTAGQGGNDGLVQRLQLFVYPDETQNWQYVDRYPNKTAKQTATNIFKTLANQDFTQWGAVQEEDAAPPFMRFGDEAQELFIEWLFDLQNNKLANPNEQPLMLEHLAKYRSLMPTLALIFHLVNVANGEPAGAVSVNATQMAVKWCRYLETHARRIYTTAGNSRLQAAAALTRKIQQGVLQDGFKAQDVYRKQWRHLTDAAVVGECLDELCLSGWLKPLEPKYSGRGRKQATTYLINPRAKTKE